jgi:PKD repeat protein
MPGQVVSFFDRTAGSAVSFSWKFGEPSSGDSNYSTARDPAHAFARDSVFTVTLVARDASGNRSTRRQKVTVTNASAVATTAGSRTVPVAGHVRGSDGRTFRTDLQIENPSASSARARLAFLPRGGEAPFEVSLDLAPRETRNVADAVVGLFGLPDSVGALRLDWTASETPLRMTSRTWTGEGEGTLGQSAVGFGESDDPRSPRYVTGLARTGEFRSNLGAVNDSGVFESFQIVLRGATGRVLGESAAIGLAPGGQVQLSMADLFPDAVGSGLTAEFRPIAGSSMPYAYATVVDNRSGDPTFYAGAVPASALYLPAVARVTGYDRTPFSSAVSIANAGSETAWVQVSFLEHDRDDSQPLSRVFPIAPRETFQVDDVLGSLFQISESYGALAVESSDFAELVVSSRISSPASTGRGTVGQQVDAIPNERFFHRGCLLGLRQDAAFRSNVGLFNPEPFGTTVTLTLRRADGSPIGSASVAVPPLGYVQRSVPALFPGQSLPAGENLTLSVESRDVDVFAFAAVIDNLSRDPTFSRGLD